MDQTSCMYIKAHKIRLNPTTQQAIYFAKACGTARFVYNWGLAAWQQHKEMHPGEAHGVMTLKKEFNAIKREQFPWVYEVAKDITEGAFFNLSAAMSNYYNSKKGLRKGKVIGFPKFKSKKNSRQSFNLNNDRIKLDGHNLYVSKLGWVNMAETLRFKGKILKGVISRQAGHWYVSVTVEVSALASNSQPKCLVGIDLGIKTLLVLSDGNQYENQVLLKTELRHLKRLSRRLSRRKMGSKRWWKAKDKLARFHHKISNRRMDYIHKITTEIVRTYKQIGIEDLNVKGMMGNHRLALSLADAAFGEIQRQLQYKSIWSNGQVIKVSRFFASSRLCSVCGEKKTELKLSEREWTCPCCGALLQRDLNAAANIKNEAIRIINQSPVVATSGQRLVDGA